MANEIELFSMLSAGTLTHLSSNLWNIHISVITTNHTVHSRAKEHHREERQFISLLDPQPSPPPAQQQQRCHNCQSEYDTGDSWEDYFVRGKDENDEEEEDDDDHEGASSSVAACPLPPAPPPSMLFLEPENGLISVNL